MADLITLSRFKALQPGINDPNAPNPKDPTYSALISAASALIRSYTGMEFNVVRSSTLPTTRQYQYDGSGWVDIDEAQNITTVSIVGNYLGAQAWNYTQYDWIAYPLNTPVKRWLSLPPSTYGISPEMGFTYNLDTLASKYPNSQALVNVTAVWGWPSIPEDIQQAAVWTAQSMLDSAGGEYQSQTIANYSRTKAYASVVEGDPIPPKARAVLESYIMPNL